jgi:hypothetical protein
MEQWMFVVVWAFIGLVLVALLFQFAKGVLDALRGKKRRAASYPPYGKYKITFVASMPLDSRLVALLDELQAAGKIAIKDMNALNPRARKP